MENNVKAVIVDFLNSPIIHTYKDYWDTDKRFEGFYDFNGKTYSISIEYTECGIVLEEVILTVETEYSCADMEIYESTTENEIRKFIITELTDSLNNMFVEFFS